MRTFDEIRAANPALAMAIYALEPGGAVTFEVITPDGQTFTWTGPTQEQVLTQAFRPEPDATTEPPSDPADIFG